MSTEEKCGLVVDTKWSWALPVNVASKSENRTEKLKSNIDIHICFHTLQVSRYPQTHVDLALPSIYHGFWTFSLEIPHNKHFLRTRDYLNILQTYQQTLQCSFSMFQGGVHC